MENPTNNNPGATPAPDAAHVLREQVEAIEAVNRRLYALADDDLGDSPAGEEAESCARALSYVQEALETKAPNLTRTTDADLSAELRRRGCAFVIITPADVLEQWKINQDADETDEPEPTHEEAADALRTISKYLADCLFDCYGAGPTSEACELISERRRQADGKGDAR
jgi:hypothetical protein